MMAIKVALLFLCGLQQAQGLAAVSPMVMRSVPSPAASSIAMQAVPAEGPTPGLFAPVRGAWRAAKQLKPSLRNSAASLLPKPFRLLKRVLLPAAVGCLVPAGAALAATATTVLHRAARVWAACSAGRVRAWPGSHRTAMRLLMERGRCSSDVPSGASRRPHSPHQTASFFRTLGRRHRLCLDARPHRLPFRAAALCACGHRAWL